MRSVALVILAVPFLIACNSCLRDHSCDGDIKISQLKNKTNYDYPLTITDDVPGTVIINNQEVVFAKGNYELPNAGFYEIVIQNSGDADTILINLFDQERGESEWGLKKWIPEIPLDDLLAAEEIILTCPINYHNSLEIPIAFQLKEENEHKNLNLSGRVVNTNKSFRIKNGSGAILIPAEELKDYKIDIAGRELSLPEMNPISSFTELSGEITGEYTIGANTCVKITGELLVPANARLIIEEGAVVMVDPGTNIVNDGPVQLNGTAINPIFITCSDQGSYWGGFISNGASATIDGQYVFFSRSGFHEGGDFNLGHAKRQALFYTINSNLNLSYCNIINNIGQIFFPISSNLVLENLLIHGAKTGGQFNGGQASLSNCIFSDFPNESEKYQDEDNDGLYISGTNVNINNCIFMYAKDDGIDSGGSAGGEITIENTIFEGCFHEGAALSSKSPSVKFHSFSNCTFRNNGQGLELGYSSPDHLVQVDSCLFEHNHVGIRYGDNYSTDLEGKIVVSNSYSINNDRDIWNMYRKDWRPKIDNMQFQNTFISKQSMQYPALQIVL